MKLSAKDLLELNIIDEIINEPLGGAHRDRSLIFENAKISIMYLILLKTCPKKKL